MNVLLIEDDVKTAAFVTKGLQQEGFAVRHLRDGRDGRDAAIYEDFDVAVIDIMLPSMDGLHVLKEIRRAGKSLPVLILSAKGSVQDRIHGLQQGGDDYLPKPFAFAELSARIQALLRRTQGAGPEPTVLRSADLSVDLLARKVFRGAAEIVLQPKEFALLEYLLRNAGRVVSKTMIIEHVWDYDFDPGTNVVESRMCRLRAKLDDPFDKPLLKTIRGVGYVLEKAP